MTEGLVSIIMPSYNASRFIAESINSVFLQAYSNWELLIVDDCSMDNSVRIAQKFVDIDKRVRLFPLEKNVGAAAARNVAIGQAKGQYIAFLDSDDVWEEDKLKKQLAFMEENSYAFTFSNYYVMEEDGRKIGNIVRVPTSLTYHQYLRNTIIGCLTVIIDRKQTGDFRMPLIKSSHDMALWLLIMKRGFKAYGMKETLAGYRLFQLPILQKNGKPQRMSGKYIERLRDCLFYMRCIVFVGMCCMLY